MTEKFKINLEHDKNDIQEIIDSGKISIVLEENEIKQLQEALASGLNEVTMSKKTLSEFKRERLLVAIGALQETLDAIREDLDN